MHSVLQNRHVGLRRVFRGSQCYAPRISRRLCMLPGAGDKVTARYLKCTFLEYSGPSLSLYNRVSCRVRRLVRSACCLILTMPNCSLNGTRLKHRIQSLLPAQLTSQERAPRYSYTPLEANQIRLLKLHPGEPGSQIQCTLKVVDSHAYDDRWAESDIPDWKRFYAISYVWGTDTRRTEILCW